MGLQTRGVCPLVVGLSAFRLAAVSNTHGVQLVIQSVAADAENVARAARARDFAAGAAQYVLNMAFLQLFERWQGPVA